MIPFLKQGVLLGPLVRIPWQMAPVKNWRVVRLCFLPGPSLVRQARHFLNKATRESALRLDPFSLRTKRPSKAPYSEGYRYMAALKA
jgi:hypothetical protein